ncbi:hypothetical protein [Rodentibacter rarus]|uniref:hypothetical protein n=1 Tax=Rodentibacter rarus TaxID=1908260 RepID=UPI001FC9EE32|nr:hypothetical protein [Rodentibacter rarus]
MQRTLRRCLVKIEQNTIELKERKGILFKFAFIIIAIASLYIDFIEPTYRRNTWESLQLTFQPESRFQRSWEFYQDPHNIGFTETGESKEQFMAEMWEEHKGMVWKGYYYVGKYLLLFFILLSPAKKRVRFDRKRGIVYTYVVKKFYITELNKLMRPFPEYISAVNVTLFIWVHPYRNKGTGTPCFKGPQIAVVARSACLPMLGITLLPFLKEELVKFNRVPYLKNSVSGFYEP